jgi:hypothetical protein
MNRHLLYFCTCRFAIPLWLLAGAIYKLIERNPKLLPLPVLSLVQSMDGFGGFTGTAWLDTATRLIILGEFLLVAAMLCMPRLARSIAIAVLSLFCVILLLMILPEFQKGGFAQAMKGSCGCFGASGPNPVMMLGIDSTLLVLALLSKRTRNSPELSMSSGLPLGAMLSVISLCVVMLVPNRAEIVMPIDNEQSSSIPTVVPPSPTTSVTTIVPSTTTNTTTSNPQISWPGFPKQAAPYYVPEFAKWVGTRLDTQDLARLMTPAPPPSINTGTWLVMFYREDCEHCHELLQNYFSGPLKTPTLTIAIPDTDPAASMEMPCSECQQRKLFKGPDYVLTTPVLLKITDGIVKIVVTDPEDRAAVERCMAP